MNNPRFFYARAATSRLPATTLVGPFSSPEAAKDGLLHDVLETEKDIPGETWPKYHVLYLVETVQPVVISEPVVTLKPA